MGNNIGKMILGNCFWVAQGALAGASIGGGLGS